MGDLPKVRQVTGVVYSGNIKSPADWYTGKVRNGYTPDPKEITIVSDGLKIQFKSSECIDQLTSTITGELLEFTDLRDFRINTKHTYNNTDLAQFLKMSRYYFKSVDENYQIVKNLNSFKAKVSREIENSNDFKGNKKQLFEQQVKTDLKLSFKLLLPIYSGEPASEFSVDIEFDVTDGGVSYWLISPELKDLQTKDANTIIERELERFGDLTIIRV